MIEEGLQTDKYHINPYWIEDAVARFSSGISPDNEIEYDNLSDYHVDLILERLYAKDPTYLTRKQKLEYWQKLACLKRSSMADNRLPSELYTNADVGRIIYKLADLHVLSFDRISQLDDPKIDHDARIAYYLGAQFMAFIASNRDSPTILTPFLPFIELYTSFYNLNPNDTGPLMEHIASRTMYSKSFQGDLNFARLMNSQIAEKTEKVTEYSLELARILDIINYIRECDNPNLTIFNFQSKFFIHGVIDRMLIDVHSCQVKNQPNNKVYNLIHSLSGKRYVLLPPHESSN